MFEEGETDVTPKKLGWVFFPLMASACLSSFAFAGVSGVGNTTDITIQLDLTRQTGVQVLRQVSSFDLEDVTGDAEAKDLYTRCRDAMYRGAVASHFQIVDEIPDGDGYMALARRRSPTEIEISRRQMEQLRDAGTLSGGVLLSVFLHEVAHDCQIGQKAIDDSYDPLINRMVQGVLGAAHRVEDSAFQDLQFVAKVKSAETVTIEDLSPGSRSALSDAYINYLGDWIFENLKERFRYRPAPATDFYATQETSVYPGWAHVKEAMASVTPEVEALVFGVMRASFEEKAFSVYRDFHRMPLPTSLACKEALDGVENLSFADCVLQVSWSSLPIVSLQGGTQKIQFQVDSLSRVRITRIEFGSFPGRAPSYLNMTLYRALQNDPCEASSKYEIQSSVCRLVNRERKRKEAEPLVLDRELSRVAQKHAEDMVKRGYFSHESPEGGTMSTRLKDAEISYGYAGENIAKGYATPREVMEGWMDSPGHRRNILYKPFRKIGIGVYEDHWVQVFTD